MVTSNSIATCIPISLSHESHDYMDRIKFSIAITVYKERKKGKQRLHYKLEQWKNKGTFDSLKIAVSGAIDGFTW